MPKSATFTVPSPVHQDVLGLDVPVYDVALVGVVHRREDAKRHLHRALRLQPPALADDFL
jgi:hypothetical protein